MANKIREIWTDSMRQNWPAYLCVIVVFTAGIAAGVAGMHNLRTDQVYELNNYLDRFLSQAAMIEVEPEKDISSKMYSYLVIILAVYVLGLTVIGIPVMLALLFARGFVLGFTIGFLIRDKTVKGITLVLAAIIPQNLFLIPALMIGGVASLSFAVLLVRRFYNSKVAVWPSFLIYSGLMLFVTAVAAGAGLVEVYVTPALVKLAASYLF